MADVNAEARSELAVAVRDLGKRYHIAGSPHEQLFRLLLRRSRSPLTEFWALRGVSLDVPRGQAVAIIGRNGSGKSTFLQLLAGTVMPSEGEARVRGRVAALLELGAGFNPEFTGRENVFLNGAVLGLADSEIEARFDEIEAFADIGPFIGQPVKTYSSGMFVRLAFAVAACVDAEILLVDEALAVGDVFFQQKCFRHIRRLQDEGVTIFYVSHDMNTVQSVCGRAVLLEQGRVTFDGDPSEAANRYYGSLGQELNVRDDSARARRNVPAATASLDWNALRRGSVLHSGIKRHGEGSTEILAARILAEDGRDRTSFEMLQLALLQLLVGARREVGSLNVGFHIYDRYGRLVFATGSVQLETSLPDLAPGDEIAVEFGIRLELQPGEYTLSLLTGEFRGGADPNLGVIHDCVEDLGPIVVTAPTGQLMPFYGIARLPVAVAVDKGERMASEKMADHH